MKYDVVIVGGSYAGLAAALCLGKMKRHVLVIDSDSSPVNEQVKMHLLLTQEGSTPKKVKNLAIKQMLHHDTLHLWNDLVVRIKSEDEGYALYTKSRKWVETRKVILAVGLQDQLPEIPGLADCWGISAFADPFYLGQSFRDKRIGLLANGMQAWEMAKCLSSLTHEIVILTENTPEFTPSQLEKLNANHCKIVESKVTAVLHTKGKISGVQLANQDQLKLSAILLTPDWQLPSNWVSTLGLSKDEKGLIQTDAQQRTNVPNVYACGDCCSSLRHLAAAALTGTLCGKTVHIDLCEEDW